jgi:O-succinylbenzoate synthase
MKSITLKDIVLHPIALPLVEPLRTSFGMELFKGAIVVEAITDNGISGWGEVSSAPEPGYTGETVGTSYHVMHNWMIALVKGQTIDDPRQVYTLIHPIRYHEHAKHGLEAAVWDAFAKANDMRLADLLAHYAPEGHESRNKAVVGVSIGLQGTDEELFEIIDKRLEQGYRRIKLKIKPGRDVNLAQAVRNRYPDISMMLDANSAYTLADADHLAELDEFNLLMVEQPLSHDDIYEHGFLTKKMNTPICLDESIKTVRDLLLALQVGAINILNLKPARVGGFTESLNIYKVCVENELPLWIGGMLEVGVGRAANVAFASLPGITLPCDISATDRYFDPDLTEPAFVLGEGSTLAVPDAYGIGVEMQRDRLETAVAQWYERDQYVLG